MKQKGKKKKLVSPYESVKLNRVLVNRVRARKEMTGVSISGFIERAIEEKLSDELRGN